MNNSHNINEYANSMFRYEKLHEGWITKCADYIGYLFGEKINGKVVVDYAFGRGNWSLAFLLAGAKEVISIDASMDNVQRFSCYCQENNIKNIKIICGNILEDDFSFSADFFWLYGIFHHIDNIPYFLHKLKGMARNNSCLFYIYAYNAKSLREFIVTTCRQLLIYKSEDAFFKNSSLFIRSARMRARDDLVAPHIEWYTGKQLQNILNVNGLHVIRQDYDFQHFLKQKVSEDFNPYQFLCSLNHNEEVKVNDNESPLIVDIKILNRVVQTIINAKISSEKKQKIAIGLFNTYCSYSCQEIKKVILEILLYLIYIITLEEIEDHDFTTRIFYDLCTRSLTGEQICSQHKKRSSYLGQYLLKNTIRL